MKTEEFVVLKDKYKGIRLISILLFVAAIASTAAYLLNRWNLNRLHERKWQEYEDCGIV